MAGFRWFLVVPGWFQVVSNGFRWFLVLASMIAKSSDDRTKNVIIIGDSMLNNVNSHGLLKSKKVEVLSFPGATSTDIVNKMVDILKGKTQSLIVHVDTNDLTNYVNLR